MDYKKSGVNIKLGDDASKVLYQAAKQTFKNRKGDIGELIVPFDDFSGLRVVDISNLPKDSVMSMGFDGVGTKVEIAQRMNNYRTIAFDLFAMVCDDAVVRGGEPILIGTVLDVNSLSKDKKSNIEAIKQLAEGYIKAAKAANVAIINGEIAELGNLVGGYGKFKYNWSAGLIWFAKKNKIFTGREIKLDDSVVVFEEKGFRSNGLSLVRKIFKKNFGDNWHNKKYRGKKLGNLVLTPSKIYSQAMVNIHGGFQTKGTCKIHGVTHITGGGLPEKLSRILKPCGYGAKLDNLFEPCKVMQYCQKLGKIKDREAYKTWNMGQGMAIITPEPEKVVKQAKKIGILAKIAGEIVKDKKIIITSQGIFNKRKQIIFK